MAVAPTFSVKQIQTYKRCPYQYFLTYVHKRPGKVVVRPAMSRGSTAHAVLGQSFNAYRTRHTFPVDLHDRVARHLPRRDYTEVDHWQDDVESVTEWVDTAISTFDPSAEVVAVEKVYAYPFAGRWGEPAFTLKSRIDLIARYDDDTVEHIDWKTGGTPIVDRIQNTSSRIVVGKALQHGHIRSTTSFLALGSNHSVVLTREDVRDTWEEIKDLAHHIIAGEDWEPVQNPLCPFCPYLDHGCPITS